MDKQVGQVCGIIGVALAVGTVLFIAPRILRPERTAAIPTPQPRDVLPQQVIVPMAIDVVPDADVSAFDPPVSGEVLNPGFPGRSAFPGAFVRPNGVADSFAWCFWRMGRNVDAQTTLFQCSTTRSMCEVDHQRCVSIEQSAENPLADPVELSDCTWTDHAFCSDLASGVGVRRCQPIARFCQMMADQHDGSRCVRRPMF